MPACNAKSNDNFMCSHSSSEDENAIGDGIPPIHTCIKSSADYELSLILKEIRFITDQVREIDDYFNRNIDGIIDQMTVIFGFVHFIRFVTTLETFPDCLFSDNSRVCILVP